MKQYRLLSDKEAFQVGDEYYSGIWRGIAESDIGRPYRENIMCPVRRIITEAQPDIPADGEPVIVGGYKRYSSGQINDAGLLLCYVDGGTKWSSKGNTIGWDHWRRPTQEELA